MFKTLDMAASGLTAQRTRMDTVAQNVLNMNTTHNERGEPIPFRRRLVVFQEGNGHGQPGVHVSQIKQDPSPFNKRFDPGHPDANADGYVLYPNVDMAIETVNMMEASRAYEATVTMMETSKAMFNSALRLIA